MWRELLTGLLPDSNNLLPPPVQDAAKYQIRHYWRTRGWQLLLGEIILWAAAVYQNLPFAWAYGVLAAAVGFTYALGWFGGANLFWLTSMVAVLGLQGLVIEGLGAVTALTSLIPYTISGMLYSGGQRAFLQSVCIAAFWINLISEVITVAPRLHPSQSILVSYDILLAAFTFQTLRFLSHLSVEISTAFVAEEVRQQSQQFLARVSHELRTPLNSVLGFAKLLRRSPLTEAQGGYAEQIVDEGEHLNTLINDLLDNARLNSGVSALQRTQVDLNALCEIAAGEARQGLSPEVRLQLELDSDLPPINGDPVRLRQVITNLVSNAVKYTERGQITIRTASHGDRVRVEVQDTGRGIPDSQRHLVFVPFVRLTHDQPGVGLGLDIALQIVRLHGGDIRLVSQLSVGSTFTVELPINA